MSSSRSNRYSSRSGRRSRDDSRRHRSSRSRSPRSRRDSRRRRSSSRRRSRSRSRGRHDRHYRHDSDRHLDRERKEDREEGDRREVRGSKSTATTTAARSIGSLVSSVELEKIARQKQEEESANLKPTFLTRKQRQQLALERRQKEFEAQRSQMDLPSTLLPQGDRTRLDQDSRRRGIRGPSPAAAADRSRVSSPSSPEDAARQKELELIKGAYLGQRQERRKPLKDKAGPKFKFAFDWDASEDTAAEELNPLYRRRGTGSLMFGRGFQAGYDRREQVKQSRFYDDLIASRGSDLGRLRDSDKVAAREERRRKQESESRLRSRHWSEKRLEEMEERDWRIFREDYSIAFRGEQIPNPLRFWNEADFPEVIHDTLRRAGYKEPTPIQRAAIPIGLQNRDVVGIAETGSGKTCAFVIPLLIYVSQQPPLTEKNAAEGPYALVLAPTRELAQQIQDECDKFAQPMGFKAVSIVGGLSIEDQSFALREGAEVIIATPGRLFDCIERRYLVLNQCHYVVLDEADRMIDMNFEPQIIQIMDKMPSGEVVKRQTIMFSATMPPKVEALAKKYLRNPVFITVGDRTGAASKSVEQVVFWTPGEAAKKKKLVEILQRAEPPIMIFSNSQKGCDTLSRSLDRQGYRTTVIHGGKIQEHRMENLDAFKKGRVDILVATDVAGRGIDVSGVKLVVNYDMPLDIERYTHRIGRTGRAGQTGRAISFLTDADNKIMYDLHRLLQEAGSHIPPELKNHEAVLDPAGIFGKKKKRGSGTKYI